MPTIKDAVAEGPLTKAERILLQIIRTNPNNIWSGSLEDLEELARWIAWPNHSIALARSDIPKSGNEVLTINSHVQIQPDMNQEPIDTYTFRTVLTALNKLHDTGRIACYSLHKRNYFGAIGQEYVIQQELGLLSPEGQNQADFSLLTPEMRRVKESSRKKPRATSDSDLYSLVTDNMEASDNPTVTRYMEALDTRDSARFGRFLFS